MKRVRLQREAASALVTDLPSQPANKQTATDELVRIAKALQRLQHRRARLRRDLKRVDADIKRAKRELKAIAALVRRGEL